MGCHVGLLLPDPLGHSKNSDIPRTKRSETKSKSGRAGASVGSIAVKALIEQSLYWAALFAVA